MLQYVVVETEDLSPEEAQYRLQKFVESYNRGLVPLGRAVKEVEIVCEPSHGTSQYIHSRPPVKPRTTLLRGDTRRHVTFPSERVYVEEIPVNRVLPGSRTPTFDMHRFHRPRVVYRPSFWDIGSAGLDYDTIPKLTARDYYSRTTPESYDPPGMEYYQQMHASLRSINKKLLEHRQLTDRYASVDLHQPMPSVSDGIEGRYKQLVDRMPELENRWYPRRPGLSSSRPPVQSTTKVDYSRPHAAQTNTEQLRGKIRGLLLKARRSSNPC